MSENTLLGQVAIITGASQGIGAAIAQTLAAQGMQLTLTARNLKNLEATQQSIQANYPQANILAVPADITDPEAVLAVAQKTMQHFGQIDALVNNAGVAGKIALLQEIPVTEVHRVIDTNVKGAAYAMQAVLPSMVAQGHGCIININSVAGKTAFPYWSVYDASKFALRAITEAVADEQRTNGIRVMGIYPGAVDTPIWEGLTLDGAPDKNGMLHADDIARAVLFVLQQPAYVHIRELTLSHVKPAL